MSPGIAFALFIGFEVVVALMVKSSGAKGTGAVVAYLVPVITVIWYLTNHGDL